MITNSFKRWDILLGWMVFVIALIIYGLTVEPTVSFWDAGEYITSSAKLQVAHPPGAPLLQLIGSFFAMFATTPEKVALMINYVSVVSSAFTILFLFWTITNLVKKLIVNAEAISLKQEVAILGSGLIGSLTFTFSDSFWFNATETEVYAMASFIMALLLWLGLKWTDDLDSPRGNKWLILISFVTGLTFGIQFMGFLAIPSIVLLYYFKRYRKITIKSFMVANGIAIAVLLFVFKFSLTYVLKFFSWSEVFFVNTIGMPFNSGSIIMGLLFILGFYFLIRYTHKKNYKTLHTLVLSVMFLLLGFSSWLMLPIRANSKVVVNENDPSDARSLLAYYNREQYPGVDSPFYGAYYTDMFSSEHSEKDDRPKYERDEESKKYVIVNKYKRAFRGASEEHSGILPRMWSQTNAENYIRYYGAPEFRLKKEFRKDNELRASIQEFQKKYNNGDIEPKQYLDFLKEAGDYIDVNPPTLWKNLEYMFHFQFGYMYLRYLMWNYVGKQNDEQGRFDSNGEWLSGINLIDNLRLGSQENLPLENLNNKGRNTYFFLPLILGLIGLVFQCQNTPKMFWTLLVFFLFTGVAIQFYTNPAIFQPRERDYSLVGSFYIFAIWIGLGFYALFDMFNKYFKSKISIVTLFMVCLIAVPGLMAHQNWDDHDRSDRYTALTMAKAYLDSTEANTGSILFTIGDIDTFPLWYVQDIEGCRTDTRVIVTSYFNTDWYIDQMKRKAYDSEPIPSQMTHDLYRYGSRDVIYYAPVIDKRWELKDFMMWVSSNRPRTKVKSLMQSQDRDITQFSESYLDAVYYPTNKIRIPVNKKKVLETGLVKMKDADLIVDYIDVDLPKTGISKSRLMMLDIIANNNWERPIYFSGGSFDEEEYIWMSDYLQLDGLVYKLVPIKTENRSVLDKGRIDTDLMYEIVKKWEWGNSGSPDIYHDPQTRRQGISYRISLARLMEKLLEEGDLERAKEIIDLAMENMPVKYFGYYPYIEPFLDGCYKVGETEKARKLFDELKRIYQGRLTYYSKMTWEEQHNKVTNVYAGLRAYQRIVDVFSENESTTLMEKEVLLFNSYVDEFSRFLSD